MKWWLKFERAVHRVDAYLARNRYAILVLLILICGFFALAEMALAYMNYCFDGGHSFDPWDISAVWSAYQENQEEFNSLLPFVGKEYDA